MKSVAHKLRTGFLELRTGHGLLYAAPSFYQRLYLLWIFRNFHSLARPVLTLRQQKFVDRLSASAVTLGADVPHRPCVIGTIEDVRQMAASKTTAPISAPRLVELPARKPVPVVVPAVGSEGLVVPRKQPQLHSRELDSPSKSRGALAEFPASANRTGDPQKPEPQKTHRYEDRSPVIQRFVLPRWLSGAASAAMLLGVLLYLAQVRTPLTWAGFKADVVSRPQSGTTTQPRSSPAPHAATAVPAHDLRASASDAMIPAPPKPETNARLKPQPPKPAAVESELSSTPRIHIPGAPDRGLTYPEAPDPNQTGIVNLRALIAPDGSVKEVIVLDGKRSLGMAAARAVRHWRYPPPDPKGQAMEAETSITFHFRGDDAVSVTFPSATPLQQN